MVVDHAGFFFGQSWPKAPLAASPGASRSGHGGSNRACAVTRAALPRESPARILMRVCHCWSGWSRSPLTREKVHRATTPSGSSARPCLDSDFWVRLVADADWLRFEQRQQPGRASESNPRGGQVVDGLHAEAHLQNRKERPGPRPRQGPDPLVQRFSVSTARIRLRAGIVVADAGDYGRPRVPFDGSDSPLGPLISFHPTFPIFSETK